MNHIEREELNALIYWLDVEKHVVSTCDNTLQLTRQWLSENGLDVSLVIQEIQEAGQKCDCEVVLNLFPG